MISTPLRAGEVATTPGYAAAAWSFLFAALSLYWALGGRWLTDTLGSGIMAQADSGDPETIGWLWISVFGKVLLGVLALALVQPWGRTLPRKPLLVLAWLAGFGAAFYGLANFIQHQLMLLGTVPIAGLLGNRESVLWHMLLWDPIWFLGGILFMVAARRFGHDRAS